MSPTVKAPTVAEPLAAQPLAAMSSFPNWRHSAAYDGDMDLYHVRAAPVNWTAAAADSSVGSPVETVVLTTIGVMVMMVVVGLGCAIKRSCRRAYRRQQRASSRQHGAWTAADQASSRSSTDSTASTTLAALAGRVTLHEAVDIEAAGNGVMWVPSPGTRNGPTKTATKTSKAAKVSVLVMHPDDQVSLGTTAKAGNA